MATGHMHKNLVMSAVWFMRCASGQTTRKTDRRTDIDTHHNTALPFTRRSKYYITIKPSLEVAPTTLKQELNKQPDKATALSAVHTAIRPK